MDDDDDDNLYGDSTAPTTSSLSVPELLSKNSSTPQPTEIPPSMRANPSITPTIQSDRVATDAPVGDDEEEFEEEVEIEEDEDDVLFFFPTDFVINSLTLNRTSNLYWNERMVKKPNLHLNPHDTIYAWHPLPNAHNQPPEHLIYAKQHQLNHRVHDLLLHLRTQLLHLTSKLYPYTRLPMNHLHP